MLGDLAAYGAQNAWSLAVATRVAIILLRRVGIEPCFGAGVRIHALAVQPLSERRGGTGVTAL